MGNSKVGKIILQKKMEDLFASHLAILCFLFKKGILFLRSLSFYLFQGALKIKLFLLINSYCLLMTVRNKIKLYFEHILVEGASLLTTYCLLKNIGSVSGI